jgi:hypothetical protein
VDRLCEVEHTGHDGGGSDDEKDHDEEKSHGQTVLPTLCRRWARWPHTADGRRHTRGTRAVVAVTLT